MDVLKDAASAAIYGARAANGVVLITTKSGEKGTMSVTYSGFYGTQNVAKQVDMLGADDYRMMMNEGARNAGRTEPFDLNQIAEHNTNWQRELLLQPLITQLGMNFILAIILRPTQYMIIMVNLVTPIS